MISGLFHLLNATASRLAVRVADWSVRNASPPQREWLMAIQSEMQSIETGGAQLRWAAGGAWIVASVGVRERSGVSEDSLHGGLMPTTTGVPWVGAVGRNAISIFLFWCALALSQLFVTAEGGWVERSVLIVVACAAGLVGAIWARADFMAYVLAGQLAFGIAELAFHMGISIEVVQGAPAHFSVMIAATLAAFLAGAAASRTPLAPPGRVWNPRDLLASARDALAALHARSRLISTLCIASLAWAVPEVLARAQFGSAPYRDGATDWAIALAAVIGAVLGAVTAQTIRTPHLAAPEFVCATAE